MGDSAANWLHDDLSISDDEILYRRVEKDYEPSRNLFTTTVDRISGERCLGKGAFSLTDDDRKLPNAGASVQLEGLMREHGIPTAGLVNWDTHGVGRFHARDVRRGEGGVVALEDPEDEVLGTVHGLLRTRSDNFPRPEWSKIRSYILEAAIWYDSDPGYEADSA